MKIAGRMTFTAQRIVMVGAVGILCLAAASSRAYAAEAPAKPASVADALPPPSSPSSESIGKNLSDMEDKVTENAHGVVKRLDTADPTTLSDLNNARQTITRIDAMIDLEKRLAELQKLRDARSGGSVAFASAIPASALVPAPPPPAGESGASANVAAFAATGHTEVSRIYGHAGRYSALLKLANGDTKTVRPGDALPGGETVRHITASSVELAGRTSSRTLRIKSDIVQSMAH